MLVFPWGVGWGQQSKVEVIVDQIERISQDEARWRVTVINTSAAPVFSTGVDFVPGHRTLDVYLEQKLEKVDWQVVAPCQDIEPSDVIQLKPVVPMVLELKLRVPLGSPCKKRDIKLEGRFRIRFDYLESRVQARRYRNLFFETGKDKPRPYFAYSDAFEIPLFQEPTEAMPRIVQGLVTDEADAPIPGAGIELDCIQNKKQTTTASANSTTDGRFEIKATLRGVCKFRINHPGFSGVVIPISDSDRRTVIDLGKTRLRISCSGPGVNCDEVTPP